MTEIRKFMVTLGFTEHQKVTQDVMVYARNKEDAEQVAKMQFLDHRRDNPTIDRVQITEQ